jgi:hypothetical protein
MDPQRLKALAAYIPKGTAGKARGFGIIGGALSLLAAPIGLLFYNSLYNGTVSSVSRSIMV